MFNFIYNYGKLNKNARSITEMKSTMLDYIPNNRV